MPEGGIPGRGLHGNASGTVETGVPSGNIRSAAVTAAAAAATLLVTDASGNVNFTVGAAVNSTGERLFSGGLAYEGPLTVTLTGASALWDIEVE